MDPGGSCCLVRRYRRESQQVVSKERRARRMTGIPIPRATLAFSESPEEDLDGVAVE